MEFDFVVDLLIVVWYIVFNWLLWRKNKDKRFRWYFEVSIRFILPVVITVTWYFYTKSLWIGLSILAGLALMYLFNYSEVFLREKFSNIGEKLVIINIQKGSDLEEPIFNFYNVYRDSSRSNLDIKKTFEENIKDLSKEEKKEYEKLILGLENFMLVELFLSLCDFIEYKFVRYLKIYLLQAKSNSKEVEEIPKVLHINAVQLEDEELHDRNFTVLCGIQGPRDEVMLARLAKLNVAMENIKVFPKWWENRLLQEKLEALEKTNDDLWEELQELKNYKKRFAKKFKKLRRDDD